MNNECMKTEHRPGPGEERSEDGLTQSLTLSFLRIPTSSRIVADGQMIGHRRNLGIDFYLSSKIRTWIWKISMFL